jgi:surface antigen
MGGNMKVSRISVIFIVILANIFICNVLYAEQCTQGVHEMLPWTKSITGNANQWVESAKSHGFKVNHSPKDNTVLYFPPNYGHEINATYGHVAVLREIDKKKGYLIQDSNGIAGRDKGEKWLKDIDFDKVEVIHNK